MTVRSDGTLSHTAGYQSDSHPKIRLTPPDFFRRKYLVVASNGGGDPPGWFLNLQDDPIVAVQVKAEYHTTRARVATAEEKPELWRIMTATGAPYDEFQAKVDREIPVVVLEPG